MSSTTFDIHYFLDIAEEEGRERKCPNCGSSDVKFATHIKEIAECDVSVMCQGCGFWSTANNYKHELERLVNLWHTRPTD